MNDQTKLNFGKHEGKELGSIPDTWFTWIGSQKWFIKSQTGYHVELKAYIKTRSKTVSTYVKKSGWANIFDLWHKSQHDDLQEWLETYYLVPEPKWKKCDSCGKSYTGDGLPMVDENFNNKDDLYMCGKCAHPNEK